MSKARVVSGMRPTGDLHIGHYFGALKNWVDMQDEFDCYYFVADWHALTTNYQSPENIKASSRSLILDWLSVGVDINRSKIYIQSRNKFIAELYLLLGMVTPVSWLERCPTYKDVLQELNDKDINNYGFLGYPVLMTADVVILDAQYVPVGVDQVPHLELSREIVRRFNHLYSDNIFVEPQAKLTSTPKLLGLDGRKMSKSYNNSILLTEDLKSVESKIKQMITDPSRIRKTDAGDPKICPVFEYHKMLSTESEKEFIVDGCTKALIGCIECKMILVKHVIELLEPIQEKRRSYEKDIDDIDQFLSSSQSKVNDMSEQLVMKVRKALKI